MVEVEVGPLEVIWSKPPVQAGHSEQLDQEKLGEREVFAKY